MSFDSRETSAYSGAPVECYRFVQGSSVWLFTSADADVVLPSGTYAREVIRSGQLDHSQEAGAGELEVRLPRDNPVARLFVTYLPPQRVALTVYRAHRGEESTPATFFLGEVAATRFEDSEAILSCLPISQALRRRIPVLVYQTQCNWPLYSAGCGVSQTAFRDPILIGTVSGVIVTSADFALRTSGWFRNGWLEGPTGERRWIVEHVGNTVTLLAPLAGLAPGQAAYAFAGCDRTETVCAAKFGNLVNHLGFARIPNRNPYQGSVA